MAEESVDRAEAVVRDLREATRQARETLSDLRRVARELQELTDTAVADCDKILREYVQSQMKALGAQTKKAMDDSVKRVFDKFDRLSAALLGEDEAGKPSLEAVARQYRSDVDEIAAARREVVAIPPVLRRPQ